MIDWDTLPNSTAAWAAAALLDPALLPHPTSARWIVEQAPPLTVLAVLHIGVATCLASGCPEGPKWLNEFGRFAGRRPRDFLERGDVAEMAASHDDFDAVLRQVGPGLLEPLVRPRLMAVRRVAFDPRPFTSAEAMNMTAVTYRQLDHWARQGWVEPSIASGSGRGGTRLYCLDDMIRLAAQRHFGASGLPVATTGEQIALIEVGAKRFVAAGKNLPAAAYDWPDLTHAIQQPGRYVVFDSELLREHADLNG